MLGLVFYTKWVNSYFVPTSYMDLYGFPFFSNQTWIFMGFFGLHKLYAQQVWIYSLCRTHMDVYGLLCCTKHVSLSIYFSLFPNTMILRTSFTLWISTLFSTVNHYGFIHWSERAGISMDFTDFFYFRDLYGLLLYALTIMDLYIVPNVHGFQWISILFQTRLIHPLCPTCIDFYGLLFYAKHAWIFMYF